MLSTASYRKINRFSEDFTSMIVNGIKEATQLIPFFCKFYCLLKSRKHGHPRHRIIPIPVSVLEVLIVIVFRVTNPDFLPPLGLLCAKLTQPFPHRNCKWSSPSNNLIQRFASGDHTEDTILILMPSVFIATNFDDILYYKKFQVVVQVKSL